MQGIEDAEGDFMAEVAMFMYGTWHLLKCPVLHNY